MFSELTGVACNAACRFDIEIFPGLRLKLHDLGVTLLIYRSGTLVLVGARSCEEMVRAFETIYPVVLKFRRLD